MPQRTRTFREAVGADARRKRPRRNESSRGDASYLLSSFLPFQNANASLVCVLVFCAIFQICVGADAHIGPAECTFFTEIYGEFVTSRRADRVVGPYNAYSRHRTL